MKPGIMACSHIGKHKGNCAGAGKPPSAADASVIQS
jgi:hypothetical protein